ncbi:MAG: hypothetical protein M1819_002181 [Sarea resinae]|nr:MAG: hypothetical protein M1819_002181 [Sarea resinae]
MGSKLFLTGSTGYIGGTLIDTLVKEHPEYDITVLLRKVPDGFKERYPKVKIIKGDYDSAEIISDAASKANIVVHCGNSDHEPVMKALLSGLLSQSTPTFLIHLGGTGIIADWQSPSPGYGQLNPKVWSDIDDLPTITSLPDEALHRNVDKLILSAAAAHKGKLHTAIVCPPDIYGPGRGTARTQSFYVPSLLSESRKVGATFYAADGSNTRSWVHMEDLMSVFTRLVEEAVKGGGRADWGVDGGYYFAATQEHSQRTIAEHAGRILHAHGLLPSPTPVQLPIEQIGAMMAQIGPQVGLYQFASNSRSRADRAPKVLGYKPSHPGFLDVLESDLLSAVRAPQPVRGLEKA